MTERAGMQGMMDYRNSFELEQMRCRNNIKISLFHHCGPTAAYVDFEMVELHAT